MTAPKPERIADVIACPDCGAEVFARWFTPADLEDLTTDGTLALSSFGEKGSDRVLLAVFHTAPECGLPCGGGRLPPGSVETDEEIGDKIHRFDACPYCPPKEKPFDPRAAEKLTVPEGAPEELLLPSERGGILVEEAIEISPLFGGKPTRGAA